MFKRKPLSAILGILILTLASCAEAPKEEAPAEAAKAAPEPEGPYYELTKDNVTTHEDWTSRNINFLGVKIGDKTTAVEKTKLGKFDALDPVGDHYRSIYDGSSYAIHTHKLTGELQKIEVFSRFADKIADAKLKKLLSSGNVDYMREAFGMEEKMEFNGETTADEYIYDAKGFRFAKYDLKGVKMNSLIFSKIAKKK